MEPQLKSSRWPVARWKPRDGPLHTLFCGVRTCSGILGYAAPYRTRTAVLDPERPAKGLDGLTAYVFLAPALRAVPGTHPPIFEIGYHARRSPCREPRRRAGVLFPDGQIESAAGPGDGDRRYIVAEDTLIAQVKVAAVNNQVSVTGVTPIPRFVITGSGAVIVHKDMLPIIVQCPKVAAHRSEVREPVEEVDEP